MKRTQKYVVTAIFGVAVSLLGGCDAKDQQSPVAESDGVDQSSISEGVPDQTASLDVPVVPEAAAPSDGGAADLVTQYEEAAANSSPAEAQAFLASAETLKEIQVLLAPFEAAIQEFMGLGGLDALTINELAQFSRRIELVEILSEVNEKMDQELPALLARLDGDSDLAKTEQRLALLKQLRQADREMYQSMKGYLTVLKSIWDQYGVDEKGAVQFSPEVDTAVIEEFNLHAANIQTMTAEQARLQQELVQLDRP